MHEHDTHQALSHSDFAISRNISRLVIKPLADPRAGNAISMPVACLRAYVPDLYLYFLLASPGSMRRENKERKGEGGQIKHLGLRNRAVIVIVSVAAGLHRKWKSHNPRDMFRHGLSLSFHVLCVVMQRSSSK